MERTIFKYGYQDEYNKLKYHDVNTYYIVLDEGAQCIYKGNNKLSTYLFSFSSVKPEWSEAEFKILYVIYDNININLYFKGQTEAEGMIWMGGSSLRPGIINDVDSFDDDMIVDSTEELGNDDQSIPTTGAVAKQLNALSSIINSISESLVNYYTKDETYNQTQITELITQIPKFSIEVVETLPEGDEISLTTVYLVPAEDATDNMYTEYIRTKKEIEGETVYSWEKLGEQKADLTDYIKKTDKATKNQLGLVYASGTKGTQVTSSGDLIIAPATEAHIRGKAAYPYPPITPKNLDYAVKVGITTNTITLTDDEKAVAKEWLGISDHAASADYATTAGSADSAKIAENANTANTATTAISATNASKATLADRATNADVSGAVSSPNGKKATLPNLAEDTKLVVINDIYNALADYYTKNNTYSKEEIDGLVSAIPKFAIEVVNTLPTSNISPTTIYLLVFEDQGQQNLYKEYIYVNNAWEMLGEQKVDLTGYATEEFVQGYAQPIGDYALKKDIPTVPVQSVNGKTGAVTLTASDVNAQPVGNYALKSEIPSVPVQSVNNKTGAVQLTYSDVGAAPSGNYALKSEIPNVPVQSVNGKTGDVEITPENIGAQPKGDYALKSEIPNVPVKSVNGKTGAVQLNASDVGAVPTAQTLTITGVDENGNSHTWKVYGVEQ